MPAGLVGLLLTPRGLTLAANQAAMLIANLLVLGGIAWAVRTVWRAAPQPQRAEARLS